MALQGVIEQVTMDPMSANANFKKDENCLQCQGEWTLKSTVALRRLLNKVPLVKGKPFVIDGKNVTKLDSVGAWSLQLFMEELISQKIPFHLTGFKKEQEALLQQIKEHAEEVEQSLPQGSKRPPLAQLGFVTVEKITHAIDFLGFLGELSLHVIGIFKKGKTFQWRNMFYTVEEVGYQALPIIALLSFLIGVVLTYQMGLQLKTYGANIYIVNLTGMAILREFGPLITAIIVAGRTSSSFAAQLGIMKINEEFDAIQTMGMSPINRLVLPKLIGTLIAVPLLTMWADVFGILGSMVMSQSMLSISFYDFTMRLQQVTELSTFYIGMSKAPVFAFIIATVGCFQGFQVGGSAASVGQRTMVSVVQAIFLIIIADALFSVLFSWRDL